MPSDTPPDPLATVHADIAAVDLSTKRVMPVSPGRPPAAIDLDLVYRAAAIGCSKDEIAALLPHARSTFYEHLKNDPALEETIQAGLAVGKATLRRLQWKGATEGNPTMLIWLGKQMLGQKDKAEISGDENAPLRVTVELVGDPAPKTIDHEAPRDTGSRLPNGGRPLVQLVG